MYEIHEKINSHRYISRYNGLQLIIYRSTLMKAVDCQVLSSSAIYKTRNSVIYKPTGSVIYKTTSSATYHTTRSVIYTTTRSATYQTTSSVL